MHEAVQFYTGIDILHCWKTYVFAVQKTHCFGHVRPHLGAVYLLHLGRLRRSGKQRHIFRGHDIRTEQTSAHEGTAALQPRYTDARTTPHMTQHQWKLTAARVDPAQILSKSCAIRTISTSGLQCSSWPSDKWHVFGSVGIFMRCQPFVFGLPRVKMSKAFATFSLPRTRWNTRFARCAIFLKLSSRLSSAAHLWSTHVHRAAMFGHRTSDFTPVSLNIFLASQTICKRSAANVPIFMGKRAMFIVFTLDL